MINFGKPITFLYFATQDAHSRQAVPSILVIKSMQAKWTDFLQGLLIDSKICIYLRFLFLILFTDENKEGYVVNNWVAGKNYSLLGYFRYKSSNMQIKGKNLVSFKNYISFLSSNSAFVIIIITKILVRKQTMQH